MLPRLDIAAAMKEAENPRPPSMQALLPRSATATPPRTTSPSRPGTRLLRGTSRRSGRSTSPDPTSRGPGTPLTGFRSLIAERNSHLYIHQVIQLRREIEETELSARRNQFDQREARRQSVLEAIHAQKVEARKTAINQRNTREHLERVNVVVTASLESRLQKLEARSAEYEQKCVAAIERHENLMFDKRRAPIIKRTKDWLELVCFAIVRQRFEQCLKEFAAIKKLSNLVGPLFKKKKLLQEKHKDADELTRERLPQNPKPTPELLKKLVASEYDFFRTWPDADLKEIINVMIPHSFPKGEVLMHQGDTERKLFVMTQGSVRAFVISREDASDQKKEVRKKRIELHASTTHEIAAPAYIGEYTIMSLEPRPASIRAITDVDGWILDYSSFVKVRSKLSTALLATLDEIGHKRQKENLAKYFRLPLDLLMTHPVFAPWDPLVLNCMRDVLEPEVLPAHQELYHEGDHDDKLYFVADKEHPLFSWTGNKENIRALYRGQSVGDFQVFFGQTLRRETVAAGDHATSVWSIDQKTLWQFGLKYPKSLLESRTIAREAYTATMERLPQNFFVGYPLFRPIFQGGTNNLAVWALSSCATPVIYQNNEVLWKEKEAVKHFVILTFGAVIVEYTHYLLQCQNNIFRAGTSVQRTAITRTVSSAVPVPAPVTHAKEKLKAGKHLSHHQLQNNQPSVVIQPNTSHGNKSAAGSDHQSEPDESNDLLHLVCDNFVAACQSSGPHPDVNIITRTIEPGSKAHLHNDCIVAGAIEVITKSPQYFSTTRAVRYCEGFSFDIERLEEKLSAHVLAQLQEPGQLQRVAQMLRCIDDPHLGSAENVVLGGSSTTAHPLVKHSKGRMAISPDSQKKKALPSLT